MSQHYIIDLRCPRCGALGQIEASKSDIPPPIMCEACIRTADRPVEMGIVQVTVQQGANEHALRHH
jgi:hypothetical protein